MPLLRAVPVPSRPVVALEPIIGPERYTRLLAAADRFRALMAGRTIWNINSTAVGGGVAELLQALVGYATDLDVPIRWTVIGGDHDFFTITKRLHNQLHGLGGHEPLSAGEAAHYQSVLAENAEELLGQIRPRDVVLLHDPQTAGLTGPLARAGIPVVWRCHVGADQASDATQAAWDFLRRFLGDARGYVFSRAQYVPPWVPHQLRWIIPPSIDPFSAKNQPLGPETVQAILATLGVLDSRPPASPAGFVRRDGTAGEVIRSAAVVCDALPTPGDPVVLQVSRWDRLKDMNGVMSGFTRHAALADGGYLILAGPAVTGVADDPEGALVYAECLAQWRALPPAARSRVMLVSLPLDDVDENAVMVNALQRHATVITQKSIAEGFGLTVAEAMWKARPVVGSAVGGIQDQLAEGTGILLPDPRDLEEFGRAVRTLLNDPALAGRMGWAAQAYIREHYLGDVHLLRYARLFGTLISSGPAWPR
ncbi:MAG: glycosyltransferase [Gemmatimonadota bacterium]